MMMRRSIVTAMALILPAIAASEIAFAQTPAQLGALTTCPSEQEVRDTIRNWVIERNQRPLWIKSIDGFEFTPVRFAPLTKLVVESGREAQDTCPARVAYSYVTTTKNGTVTTTRFGERQTHHFYKNPFGEWVFKTASN